MVFCGLIRKINIFIKIALKADEAFLCGPRCEFMPVTKIDRSFVNEGKVGEIVPQLQKVYMEFVAKECPKK